MHLRRLSSELEREYLGFIMRIISFQKDSGREVLFSSVIQCRYSVAEGVWRAVLGVGCDFVRLVLVRI